MDTEMGKTGPGVVWKAGMRQTHWMEKVMREFHSGSVFFPDIIYYSVPIKEKDGVSR